MILCCGEALIDILPDGAARPGGALFNTALALGRLGVPVALFWGLSSDRHGARLRAALAGAGVDIGACVASDRPTTLVRVDLAGSQPRYSFEDEGSAGRMLTPADLPAMAAEALVLGGISLAAEPCGTAMETMLERAAGRVPVLIDPNIRPAFIRDEGALRARLGRMLPRADIVKLSAEDLDWLTPDPGAQVADWLAAGVALVCVTDGAAGVRAYRKGGVTAMPALPVTVADTVGAGDTFNAGLLAGLWRAGALSRAGLDGLADTALEAALRLGVTAAAVTVSRPGADPPWAHELG